MNGLDKIIAGILDEAEQAAKKTVEDAESRAGTQEKEACEAARAEAASLIAEAEKNAETSYDRASSAASLEERKVLLSMKHELIDETLTRLSERLTGLDESSYVSLLAAVARTDRSGGMLVFSERDKMLASRVMDKLDSRYTLSDVADPSLNSGFVLVSGRARTVCTVDAFVKSLRRELEPLIAARLFGTADGKD